MIRTYYSEEDVKKVLRHHQQQRIDGLVDATLVMKDLAEHRRLADWRD